MLNRPRPLALIILDGWGYREETQANAIAAARKPNWDALWANCPHLLVSGCGRCVGLPDGQMGNSEVGHLNMGAGRVVHQDLTRIDLEIEEGTFFKNPILIEAVDHAIQNKKAIHILGLLSPGGVHSHEEQLIAMLKLAQKRGAEKIYFHVFLDGRDTPPRSAEASLRKLISEGGKIASMIGRYYAMDRDKRWERTQKAYELLVEGKSDYQASDAIDALQSAYARGETDEFVRATAILEGGTIQSDDTVIFMNFRADRARQLTRALIDESFEGFTRNTWPRTHFVTLTEYDATFKAPIAYPPERLSNTLSEYLSQLGLTQLRIAETEKYAHVTFFFNGGIEKAYPGEDRVLIPSPKVATYDLQPEMSAPEVTERLVQEIKQQRYDVIICNFANPDMLGHTGNFDATVKAIETIDTCIGKIIAALREVGGEAVLTADHGNAELMFDEKTQQAHTAHTHELVPLLYVGRKATPTQKKGVLADIAPTLLYLLGLPKPLEMTGKSLLKLNGLQ